MDITTRTIFSISVGNMTAVEARKIAKKVIAEMRERRG